MPKPTGPSDPNTVALIRDLRKKGAADKKHSFWTVLSKKLAKPRRQRPVVNLSKISRYAKSDELVVIPGKVLASGEIKGSYTIAALNFSEVAEAKIVKAGGKVLSLQELLKLPASELQKIRILA
ncbi:50S ribosomal protein L18e [Candidatus Heimdallarchaeota archaeon]|nr:MAG: 50S ribosomal protein L18e [Candidatus Gerdarchaeota archaeon]RLI69866.1 MAG: 50S ribosomal protein L18e [Candidatus Gerdarchaeota archaeon]RLI74336.1 MAG: 50S ribosomal protein L18e [Candidatus Heimdallarchaeota archaeon]